MPHPSAAGARGQIKLTEGSFRLSLYLCLHASRDSGCLTVNESDLARTLHKSRRSIITYLEELCRQQVCRTAPAVNQHQGGEIEICDAFWPYHKATTPTISPQAARYVEQIRTLLTARPSVQTAFTPAEQKMAATLFANKFPLEQVERAILLGCARKCVTLLNGQWNGPITSLMYFRGPIDEVGQLRTTSEYWNYLKLQLQRLEAQWLGNQNRGGCANFATGKPATTEGDETMMMTSL